MKRENPEIRIKNAWLLRDNVSEELNKLFGDGKPLLSHDKYDKYVDNYKKAWEPYEKLILNGMQKIIGMQFKQNIIDVYIAPWFNAFSDPMVIGIKFEPDLFVDVLTHELIHRLLTDNRTIPDDVHLVDFWKELFGKKHNFGTLVHIPVHAIHKSIYLDILKQPQRFERDINDTKTFKIKDYINAWDYIEKHDYKDIIKKLQNSYKKLGKQR